MNAKKGNSLLIISVIILAILGAVIIYKNQLNKNIEENGGSIAAETPLKSPHIEDNGGETEMESPTPIPNPDGNDNSKNLCQKDDDCILVLKDDFGCNCGSDCGNYFCPGDCKPIDLSLDKWIPVNQLWFLEKRKELCIERETVCPGCLSQSLNENFIAKCLTNKCQKVKR